MAQVVKTIATCEPSTVVDTTGICPAGQSLMATQAIVLTPDTYTQTATDFQSASVVGALFFVGLMGLWGITQINPTLNRLLKS